jgi:D-alanine-D-alanine ligase
MASIIVLHQGVNESEIKPVQNSWEIQQDVTAALRTEGHNVSRLYLDNHMEWFRDLQRMKEKKEVDLVFNCADLGIYQEIAYESHIASFMEVLKIPFTGSGSAVLRSTLDKYITKLYTKEMGIPTPQVELLSQWDELGEGMREKRNAQKFPVILKQRNSYGSYGMTKDSVMYTPEQVRSKVEEIQEYKGDLMQWVLEEYLEDTDFKELSCFFLGNTDRSYLKVAHFAFRKGFDGRAKFRDYDIKWDEVAKAEFSGLPESLEEMTKYYTGRVAELFGITDYGRFDYRVKRDATGKPIPYIIDINANPDIHSTGHTLKNMIEGAGMTYNQLIVRIANEALERARLNKL